MIQLNRTSLFDVDQDQSEPRDHSDLIVQQLFWALLMSCVGGDQDFTRRKAVRGRKFSTGRRETRRRRRNLSALGAYSRKQQPSHQGESPRSLTNPRVVT